MRRTITGAALIMAGILLTGCGGDSGDGGKSEGKSASAAKPKKKWGPPETHKVTFEVKGTGSSQIGWAAGDNHFETADLPWKKTAQVTLQGAELKAGVQIYVTPQSVKGADGTFVFPSCAIEVDGKQVDENPGGESSQGCKYTLRGS
ncbi:hypothetical protein FM076_02395 [Streptomyces albus subsp. chlorinus]|uniref:hypothetical protein n=1 Tax=Streptomyces albus TaxID=1888 RepID=UPI00156E724E|nr:hypothetical protein [Streptomyces albus]NSC20119.1 hypothetical protein [Streptomyces albus subsp. chlorinus]